MEWTPISDGLTLADQADASVLCHLIKLLVTHVRQNFGQRFGGAAGRVLFETMMHLHHFQIKKSVPKISAALRVSQNRVLTPVEKFDASTIGMAAEAFTTASFFRSRMPGGLPMTIAFWCFSAKRRGILGWPGAN